MNGVRLMSCSGLTGGYRIRASIIGQPENIGSLLAGDGVAGLGLIRLIMERRSDGILAIWNLREVEYGR